jgi:hypothetical protein
VVWGGIAVLIALTQPTYAQSQVPEIAASDLPAYLKANEKVMVLFTSPDRKCGFCVGADKGFEQAVQQLAASQTGNSEWRYIVVQWQPWRDFPPQVKDLGVGSVPSRGAFVHGKAVGWADGRETNIDHLAQGLVTVQAGQRWSPLPAPHKPTPNTPKADTELGKMSQEEFFIRITKPMRTDWVDVQARREFLQVLLKRCTVLHDRAEVSLRPLRKEWDKKVFETAYDVSQANWLETTEGVRAIAKQQALFEHSLRQQTGLAPQDDLSLVQCQKLFAAATERPVPPQPPRGSWIRGLNPNKESKQ